MWTPATRGRMAEIEKNTKRYPTNLTDEEWAQIEPFLPGAAKAAGPDGVARGFERDPIPGPLGRRLADCRGLSALTDGLPVVRRFVRRFLFQTIHDVALMLDRERVGREASPTGGVIDNQSVKAPEAKTRGYDAGEKIVGRKRHIAVDTDSRLLMVNLTTADISEGLFDSSSRGECPLFAHRCLPLRRLRRRPPAGRLAIWPCRGHLGACGRQPMAREDARGLILRQKRRQRHFSLDKRQLRSTSRPS